ncbi:uncharacterized protein LOC135167092 [Diachasmimorpha longicaudata]|uniref:uncharacterized protein LOC135167092 n=1 Tax=Diachasmimorpha longicaudata TaxID=58733 RepID=UPI0030B8A218
MANATDDTDLRKVKVNRKFLTSNNKPLNFYLDGFDVLQFLETATIIRKFGGNIAPPDAETVVLSMPDCVPKTDQLRFHIDWLYHSLRKGELQDIGRYLLPARSATDTPTSVSSNKSSTQSLHTVNDSISDDENAPNEQSNIEEPKNTSVINKTMDATSRIVMARRPSTELEVDNSKDDEKLEERSTSSDSTHSSNSDDDSPPLLSPVQSASQRSSKALQEIPPYCQINKRSCVQIKKPYVQLYNAPASLLEILHSPKSLRSDGRGKDLATSSAEKSSSDLSTSPKRNVKDESVVKRILMTPDSGTQKPLRTVKKRGMKFRKNNNIHLRRRYTKAEDEKIIKYVTTEGRTHPARLINISYAMHSAGVLPNRTFDSIHTHLQKFIHKIRRFTDDLDVIQQFESLR